MSVPPTSVALLSVAPPHQTDDSVANTTSVSMTTEVMATGNWARPHSYGGKGWVSGTPNENYYHVPPAAGVDRGDLEGVLLCDSQYFPKSNQCLDQLQ